LVDEIELRLNYLEHLGYIDGEGLLPRGEFAAGVFGYELLITEAYFEGMLHQLDEPQINAMFAALVYEGRKDTRFFQRPPRHLRPIFGELEGMRQYLNREAAQFKLPPQATELDPRIAPSMIAWCEGITFEELRQLSTMDDGDTIRTFRIVADLLRQLSKTIHEPQLRQKVQHAMDMIYRDEVDARRAFNL
jgi:superfamily II RNA helicase